MAQNLIGMSQPPSDDPIKKLFAIGSQAQADGSVTPDDVQSKMKEIGVSDPRQIGAAVLAHAQGTAPIQSILNPAQNQRLARAAGVDPNAKNTQKKAEETSDQKNMTSQKRDSFMQGGQLQDLADQVQGLDSFRAQKSDDDNLQNMLSMQQAKGGQGGWIQGASAAADFLNPGSHLTATAPQPGAQSALILKYQDELAKRRNDMNKSILEGVTKMKNGQDMTQQNQELKNMMMMGQGLGATAGLANSREQMQAQRTVNNDPILRTYVPRLDGAQKILNLMQAARSGDVASNQAMLGQLNAEISRLETGSQSPGLGAAEKTEMKSAAAHYHDILDTLSGNVTGVDLSKKYDQAEAMVKDLGRSYVGSVDKRMDLLKSGALPSQTEIFEAKHGTLRNAYSGVFDKKEAAKSPLKRPKPLEQMTKQELDAYEASLHKGG